MNNSNKFSPEVRERAERLVREHCVEYPSPWAAVESIAPKIGCVSQTPLDWSKRAEVDADKDTGSSASHESLRIIGCKGHCCQKLMQKRSV